MSTKNPSSSSSRHTLGWSLLNAPWFCAESIAARPQRSVPSGPSVSVRVSANRPNDVDPSPTPLNAQSVYSWAHLLPSVTLLTPPGKPPLSWVDAGAYSSQSVLPTIGSAGCLVHVDGHTTLRLSSEDQAAPVDGFFTVVSGPR